MIRYTLFASRKLLHSQGGSDTRRCGPAASAGRAQTATEGRHRGDSDPCEVRPAGRGRAACWLLGSATTAEAQSTESISGQVIHQATETGISGVAVKVFDTAGDPFGSTITGPNGGYSFTGLSSGNYLIQEATPTGFYQTNPSFPNVLPTPESTPGSYGNNTGNWNYTGGNGTVGPPNWVINGTPAPFESALNLTGPTVNLGNILGLDGLTNFTTTNLVNKEYQLQVVPRT